MAPKVFSDIELRSISSPTLVIAGDQDERYDPIAVLQRVAHLMPEIETELVYNAGHFAYLDQPDAVTGRILRFLC